MVRKTIIAVILCLVVLLLSGCNSREDVKYLTPEEMTEYVQERVGEEIELVSVVADESKDRIDYVYNIVSRDIDFEVSARKWAPTIDGAVFGNYTLAISIKYTEGVKKHYQAEGGKLAEVYNLRYQLLKNAVGYITVDAYSDIDNLTDFIIALDRLYALEIIDIPFDDETVGFIKFSDRCSIGGVSFSRDSNSRLNRDTLKEKIIEKYVIGLKMADLTDSAIPKDIWDKYSSES